MGKTDGIDVRETTTVIFDSGEIRDSGRVRIGNMTPAFPPVCGKPAGTSDAGKVRMGSVSPAFPPVRGKPAGTGDAGKVRIGSVSPAFPPVPSR